MQREQLHTLKNNWRLSRRSRSALGRLGDTETEEEEEGRHSEIEHYMNVRIATTYVRAIHEYNYVNFFLLSLLIAM